MNSKCLAPGHRIVVVASGSSPLRGEFSDKTIPLRPPIHFAKQNAEMFDFGVWPATLFDRLHNLLIAVIQPLLKGLHLFIFGFYVALEMG